MLERSSYVRPPIPLRLQVRSPSQIMESERREFEIERRLAFLECVNCLKEGFNLEDLHTYLETVELRKMIHRTTHILHSLNTVEREVQLRSQLISRSFLEMKDYLTALRRVQSETMGVLHLRSTEGY